MNVKGQTAFITGAARGIGFGIAQALAEAGASIVLADVDEQELARAQAILSKYTSATTFVLDVRDRAAFAQVSEEAERHHGPISILVNNAGVAGGAHVRRMTFELWDWVVGVNFMGVINGIQTFLPKMLERKTPAYILNTASVSGLIADRAGPMYHSTKFGVVGLSESLRIELEPYGIGVGVLCPAFVKTDALETAKRLKPRSTPPAATKAAEHHAGMAIIDAIKSGTDAGLSIDVVGRMALAGIQRNALHILTDDMVRPMLEARAAALIEAIPVSGAAA